MRPTEHSTLERSDAPTQFVWYVVVGGLSFAVDLVVFSALLYVGAHVMIALVIGFLIGTLANYGLSLSLAFTGGRFRRSGEVLRLFAVALVGLGLTALLVWMFMAFGGLTAFVAKIIATPIALAWNFAGRRLFVFQPDMPLGIWLLSRRVLTAASFSDQTPKE
jgi:putative flippase GtrA